VRSISILKFLDDPHSKGPNGQRFSPSRGVPASLNVAGTFFHKLGPTVPSATRGRRGHRNGQRAAFTVDFPPMARSNRNSELSDSPVKEYADKRNAGDTEKEIRDTPWTPDRSAALRRAGAFYFAF
jgi:hypothetical protein